MYHIIICGAQLDKCNDLEHQFTQYTRLENIQVNVQIAWSVQTLSRLLEQCSAFDLLVLDSALPCCSHVHQSCCDISRKIYSKTQFLLFYQTQSDGDHLTLHSTRLGYPSVKPASFSEALDIVLKDVTQNDRLFRYKKYNDWELLPLSSIYYFEKNFKQVQVVFEQGADCFYAKLDTIAEALDCSSFVKIRAGCLVNCDYIASVLDNQVVMRNGDVLPVTPKHMRALRNVMRQWEQCAATVFL